MATDTLKAHTQPFSLRAFCQGGWVAVYDMREQHPMLLDEACQKKRMCIIPITLVLIKAGRKDNTM